MLVWFAVLIAVVPAFAVFVYVARTRKSMWLAFALGAIGWTVALYVRLPILNFVSPMIGLSINLAISSLFAGIFEECIRYGLMRKIRYLRIDWKHVLSFGLGWGFFEAVLIFAVNMLAAVYMLGLDVPFFSMLTGAVERNFAVILHVAFAFIVYKTVASRNLAWLGVAIALHAAVDFIATTLYYVFELPAWHVEIISLAIIILIIIFAHKIVKKEMKPQVNAEDLSRIES